jgi:uncharacterized protein YecT (DUF1311 family)
MNAGDAGRGPGRRRALAALLLAGLAAAAQAIDNPDAPDRVAAFAGRAAPLEQQLAATDGGSAAVRAGRAYADFLDAELNTAYQALLARLQPPARTALVESQRRWLRFRDSEQAFIGQQWTAERHGSSASLSVAGYGNALVRQRVVQLLQYSAEYP